MIDIPTTLHSPVTTFLIMSHCEDHGKDRVIFLTKEDSRPEDSKVVLPDQHPEDQRPGLIGEDGSINWSCPCLGGMAVGPCGVEFREAFECFHTRYTLHTHVG